MQRMTWNEIKNHFPNMSVGLTDVKYCDDDGVTVESAIVAYTSKDTPRKKLLELALSEQIYLVYTSPNSTLQAGVID